MPAYTYKVKVTNLSKMSDAVLPHKNGYTDKFNSVTGNKAYRIVKESDTKPASLIPRLG